MKLTYSQRISSIYNALAQHGFATQNNGGMWYETKGVAIYQKGDSYQAKRDAEGNGTDEYTIRIELNDVALRDQRTKELENIFKGMGYVTVEPPQNQQVIGPRS